MHPLAQDMPLGHRSELDHQKDYQDDMMSNSTQSRYVAMQMYIDSVLSQVQWTDLSTSDAGPSEPCAGSSQQPGDAGLSQFSPDVMTFSQHGLYEVGASQILTDEVIPDEIIHSQPPQSTVDSEVDNGNADFKVGIDNTDYGVGIVNGDCGVSIANADSILASGPLVTKLPT
ncbi:hypothetical protein Taro_025860 [Colocasia esculenta]|uniref:Uncharacterized protein n=1 Tax=Colocasia esculenta TaxID=4460 RepID=A0A843VPJ5_COLES|nr:hypothetical protein [Colocasia esculenta]